METLDLCERLALYYIGFLLGVYLGKKGEFPVRLRDWMLAWIVYSILVFAFAIAEAALKQCTGG